VNPAIVIPIAAFLTAIALAVGVPVARAIARRIDAEARQPKFPSEIMGRLERMEQSLDAVAVEVERISEGQRFTTRLLSEGSGNRLPARGGTGSPQDSP
jgi:hypothetical protein